MLFADVKGSMELAEQLDPEAWSRDHAALLRDPRRRRRALRGLRRQVHRRRHHGALRRADRARGPRPARLLRGAAPARRARALRQRGAARSTASTFSVRIGLNSGEVVVGTDRRRPAHGLHGAGAHRRPGAAHGGARRVGTHLSLASTRRGSSRATSQLDDLGEYPGEGRRRAGAGLRPRGRRRVPHAPRRLARPRPLALRRPRPRHGASLEAALERARSGNGQVVGVVAEAGTGKSRLCFEFLERCRARGIPILEGRGVAHGKTIPFLPMLELFRAFFGITDERRRPKRRARRSPGGCCCSTRASARCCRSSSTSSACPTRRTRRPRIDPEQRQKRIHGVVKRRAPRPGVRRGSG